MNRLVQSCVAVLVLSNALQCSGTAAPAASAPSSASANADAAQFETEPQEPQANETTPNDASNELADSDPNTDSATANEDTAKLPSKCAETEQANGPPNLCTPDERFAAGMLAGDFPGVALVLFAKGSPWTRAYMTRNLEAWNATAGRPRKVKLQFDEEVLVLQRKKPSSSAMLIVNNGDGSSYDVLRWDGSTVSVMGEEVTLRRPPQPKRPVVVWDRLDEGTKQALLNVPRIKTLREQSTAACDGSAAAKCQKAEAALGRAIVDFVVKGGEIPAPTKRP